MWWKASASCIATLRVPTAETDAAVVWMRALFDVARAAHDASRSHVAGPYNTVAGLSAPAVLRARRRPVSSFQQLWSHHVDCGGRATVGGHLSHDSEGVERLHIGS